MADGARQGAAPVRARRRRERSRTSSAPRARSARAPGGVHPDAVRPRTGSATAGGVGVVTYVKLDDSFGEDDRVLGLTDKAYRLHIAALCACSRNLTDGEISTPRLTTL